MTTNEDLGGELTDLVIGAAIEVHRELGCGLLESIYEEALCHELGIRAIPFVRQQEVDVIYKGFHIKGQRLDLLVDGSLVVELKATSSHHEVFTAQLWSYLKSTHLPLGLLLNFGLPTLKQGIKRIANSHSRALPPPSFLDADRFAAEIMRNAENKVVNGQDEYLSRSETSPSAPSASSAAAQIPTPPSEPHD